MKNKKAAFDRNLMVIKNLQKMNESELDSFMEEFELGLRTTEVSHERLSFFLQLLLQMEPRLAQRFMESIENEDKLNGE